MRSSLYVCASLAVLYAGTAPSAASVLISNAPTANMTCSAGVCTPTASDAVLNVQVLEALLAAGNATVRTTGSGVQADDIRLDARLQWSDATTLALDAFHSIGLNRALTVAGTGGVSLTTNDGGSGGEFWCSDTGRLRFSNLSSTLTINSTPYMLVNSVASLASAIAANPSGTFALANNYNAKKDGTYVTSPISTVFNGSFNGLGNAISNLSINDPTEYAYVGLFAETATASAIANVHLVNENVQDSSGYSYVGGLVGIADGAIARSFASGTVIGSGSAGPVGGLVGSSETVITGSGSTATVSGAYAGGLIGSTTGGLISDSWATGNISGTYGYVGGLVGVNGSDIKHSWASGQVSGTGSFSSAGGLVGKVNFGSIERSHASGAVTCQQACGGLVGWAEDLEPIKISQSYATGTVTAASTNTTAVGGLVGDSVQCETCEIANSYALGAVTATYGAAGGLVGGNGFDYHHHDISSSYATGTVNGASGSTGGLGRKPNKIIAD